MINQTQPNPMQECTQLTKTTFLMSATHIETTTKAIMTETNRKNPQKTIKKVIAKATTHFLIETTKILTLTKTKTTIHKKMTLKKSLQQKNKTRNNQ